MNILVVDDDMLVSNALKTILESDDALHVTGSGEDGEDAVRLYGELKPDVLLMDIRMKNLNGLDASRRILDEYPEVYTGQTVFGTEIISKIPDLLQQKNGFDYASYDIGEKEYTLITLVADGFSNREIAEKMYLSEGTVRNYLSNILEKLDLRDRTQLAVFYYQHL